MCTNVNFYSKIISPFHDKGSEICILKSKKKNLLLNFKFLNNIKKIACKSNYKKGRKDKDDHINIFDNK